MKVGVLIQPKLRVGITRIKYATVPYDIAAGITRAMQRFAVLALTTRGTDVINPSFGTELSSLPYMNMYDRVEVELFIREQLKSAISQFFSIQNSDALTEDDIIDAIDIVSIKIDEKNNVSAELMFYPRVGEAVTTSLEV